MCRRQTRDLVAKISYIFVNFTSAVEKHCYEMLQPYMRFLQLNLWSGHRTGIWAGGGHSPIISRLTLELPPFDTFPFVCHRVAESERSGEQRLLDHIRIRPRPHTPPPPPHQRQRSGVLGRSSEHSSWQHAKSKHIGETPAPKDANLP